MAIPAAHTTLLSEGAILKLVFIVQNVIVLQLNINESTKSRTNMPCVSSCLRAARPSCHLKLLNAIQIFHIPWYHAWNEAMCSHVNCFYYQGTTV